jgi:hypothetical protein
MSILVDIEAVACDGLLHFGLGRRCRTGEPVTVPLSGEEAHFLAMVLAMSGEPVRALVDLIVPSAEAPMPVH